MSTLKRSTYFSARTTRQKSSSVVMSTLNDEVEALKAKAAKLRQEAEESAKVSVANDDVSDLCTSFRFQFVLVVSSLLNAFSVGNHLHINDIHRHLEKILAPLPEKNLRLLLSPPSNPLSRDQ